MTKFRHRINPMIDIVAKKIFNDHEITIDFIQTFLGFRPKSVQLKIARQMLAKNFTDDLIKELTGLSQKDLDGLKAGIE
ncbi:TPA: hypothetical protein ACGO2X_000713 [Streptococcus suis]